MKVIEHYEKSKEPLISFEVIPPIRGKSVKQVFDVIEELIPFNPPFIDVTSHSAESYFEELPNGEVRRYVRRKRPGTIGLCAAILNKYGIDPVPHLLCNGFTKEETEDALIELNYLGIHNILAIRGDDKNVNKPRNEGRDSNKYAIDLVGQIQDMNNGVYLENIINATETDFCVGVAGYPEKHFEAPNFDWDVEKLKQKVKAGADYIVTQMFYDNAKYFNFVEKCREIGIKIPIVPGLKVLTSYNHLNSLPKHFHLSIPGDLALEIEKDLENVTEIGIGWSIKQAMELLEYGVPGVHFYVMSNPKPTLNVVKGLKSGSKVGIKKL